MLSPIRAIAPLAIALTTLVAASFAGGPVSAQENGSYLTIHSRVCPPNVVVDSYFDDCHDTSTGSLDFFVDGPGLSGTVTVDEAGNATIGPIEPGNYAVSGGVPGEFATTYAYCSADGVSDDGLVLVPAGTSFTARVPEGLETTCDVYAVGEDLRGETPTPSPVTPVATRGPVTTLPNTGTGQSDGGASGTLAPLLALIAAAGVAAACGLRPRAR